MYSLSPSILSPYLLENTLPLLLKTQDEVLIRQLDEMVNRIYFNFKDNEIAVLLKALMEFKLRNYLGVCTLIDTGNIKLNTYKVLKIYCDSLWALGRKKLVIGLIQGNFPLVLNSPVWVKIQFISQIIDIEVLKYSNEYSIQQLVHECDDSFDAKALLARYFYRIGRVLDAINLLEQVLSKSEGLPKWILEDLVRYKSSLSEKLSNNLVR